MNEISNETTWGEVVFTPEEINNEEWRNVDSSKYVGLLVSSLGRVAKITKQGIVLPTPHKSPTTKGYYYTVSAIRHPEYKGAKVPSVHRLVIEAFKGEAPNDGKKYEVNHIDGNKINNKVDNLEWVTRSSNVKHAFDTGLNINSINVHRVDTVTGEVKKYVSILECARDNDIKHHQVKRWTYRKDGALFKDRYQFILFREGSKVPIHPVTKPILGKDYRTGNIYVFDTAGEMGHVLGVLESSVRLNSRKNTGRLCNGCVFFHQKRFKSWPEFSKEEVEKSVQRYARQRAMKDYSAPIYVTDFWTGDRFIVHRYTEIMRIKFPHRNPLKSGFPPSILSENVRKNGVFNYHEYFLSEKGFPNLDDVDPDLLLHLVNRSRKLGIKRAICDHSRATAITDLSDDTTSYWPNVREFLRSRGEDPTDKEVYRYVRLGRIDDKYSVTNLRPYSFITTDN